MAANQDFLKTFLSKLGNVIAAGVKKEGPYGGIRKPGMSDSSVICATTNTQVRNIRQYTHQPFTWTTNNFAINVTVEHLRMSYKNSQRRHAWPETTQL